MDSVTAGEVVLRTERLRLREYREDDAAFLLELVSDGDFRRFIGDRGVRDEAGAGAFIRAQYLDSYAKHGYGGWVVELLETGEAIGSCGFTRKPWLDAHDIGYAFLPRGRGRGHALEAARAVLAHGRTRLGLEPCAVVMKSNAASIRVLEAIGLVRGGALLAPDGEEVWLYR